MINLKKITNFIYSINKNDVDKIKIERKDTKILINKIRIQQNSYKYIKNIIKSTNKENHDIIQIKDNTRKTSNKVVEEDRIEHSTIYSTIISPMVGTFYKSPAPNEVAFIEINEIVKPKQTVCIIEAMKLMNEIESEVKGEVVEILVNDGDIVDCGQALMKVKII
uniref:Biotin carboxyl carrier protein of acetyl-CoA carboxylase n=1 Tax=Thaumatella adunca TaxID=2006976 RepID=A0A1Z1MNN4_9FLOR|nr:acetyl-CoA carboxylase biotin carboxyl carrier protein [Thaumatella adunca]ARW67469.1 acetyl-CoA carboxylase biotin carboxyl carrier protein [Thaumatella adunca]